MSSVQCRSAAALIVAAAVLWPFFLLIQYSQVHADLPIHATLHDIRGLWAFHLSAATSEHQTCGSSFPNRNPENLRPDLDDFAGWMAGHIGGSEHTLMLNLTDRRILTAIQMRTEQQPSFHDARSPREHWRRLAVDAASDSEGRDRGTWTMVYSEGFEIQYGDLTLFALIDYHKSSEDACRALIPQQGDGEDATGETHCYFTNPARTKLGWYTRSTPDGSAVYGCFLGVRHGITTAGRTRTSRIVAVPASPVRRPTHVIAIRAVGEEENKIVVPARRVGWKTFASAPNTSASESTPLLIGDTIQSGHPCPLLSTASRSALETNTGFPNVGHRLPSQYSSVPNPFDPDTTSNNDPWSTLSSVPNQGDCGACYAIASTFVLEARARLLLATRHHRNIKETTALWPFSTFSFQSILSCSFYNQGCSGGYPFLVGKWAKEIGIPPEPCMGYTTTDATPCWIVNQTSSAPRGRWPEACAPEASLFASTYGYVGGCYECCSEQAMMEEVYAHGPIVAAIDAPKALSMYHSGVYTGPIGVHTGWCDDPTGDLNGWEYTVRVCGRLNMLKNVTQNHAVAIVGWGEDPNVGDGPPMKYWIVRNSWGPAWGRRTWHTHVPPAHAGLCRWIHEVRPRSELGGNRSSSCLLGSRSNARNLTPPSDAASPWWCRDSSPS